MTPDIWFVVVRAVVHISHANEVGVVVEDDRHGATERLPEWWSENGDSPTLNLPLMLPNAGRWFIGPF